MTTKTLRFFLSPSPPHPQRSYSVYFFSVSFFFFSAHDERNARAAAAARCPPVAFTLSPPRLLRAREKRSSPSRFYFLAACIIRLQIVWRAHTLLTITIAFKVVPPHRDPTLTLVRKHASVRACVVASYHYYRE